MQLFTIRTQIFSQNGMVHDENCVQIGFLNMGQNIAIIKQLNLPLPAVNLATLNSTNIWWMPILAGERDMTRYTVQFPAGAGVDRNRLIVFYKVPIQHGKS